MRDIHTLLPVTDYDTYVALRDHDITNPRLDPHEWRLGQASSWAHWGPAGAAPRITAENRALPSATSAAGLKASIADLSRLSHADRAEFESSSYPLTPSVVLLGLNFAGTSLEPGSGDFFPFHHPGATSTDHFLRASVELAVFDAGFPDPYPAPYVTDVFKLAPTPFGPDLVRAFGGQPHPAIDHGLAVLRFELETLTRANHGQPPILIALGNHAHDWLSGRAKHSDSRQFRALVEGIEAPLHKAIHYANVGRVSARASQIEVALRSAIDRALQ